MGKLKGLDIVYKDTPVFAGQTLHGSIHFVSKDNVSLRSISVTFDGNSKVSFSAAEEGKPERYFHLTLPLNGYLAPFDNGVGKHRLPPGPHAVPFRFPLPPSLPASFGGKDGYVYYAVSAKLITSGGAELKTTRPFQVVGLEDLNWSPQAAIPYSTHEGFEQRLLCLKVANVSVALSLPRTGFVSGETIPISGEILNRSSRKKLKDSRISLLQHTSATLLSKTKESSAIVAELGLGDLEPGGLRRLEEEALELPALPPSYLRGCRDLALRYELLLSIQPNIELRVPILIGTIPFNPDSLRRLARALPWPSAPNSRRSSRLIEDGGPLPPKESPTPKAKLVSSGYAVAIHNAGVTRPQSRSPSPPPSPPDGFGAKTRGPFPPPPVFHRPPPPPPHHQRPPHAPPPPGMRGMGGPRPGIHLRPPPPGFPFPHGLSGNLRRPPPPLLRMAFGHPPPPFRHPPPQPPRSRRSWSADSGPIVEEPSESRPPSQLSTAQTHHHSLKIEEIL